MSAITTEIVLIGVLLVFNGLLAMSEIAIISSRKGRLRQRADEGDRGATAALALAEEPTRFLSTVQIGITLVDIFARAFGGATIAEQLGESLATIPLLAPYAEAICLGVVVAAIAFLSLIVGELMPKRLALNAHERIAASVARPASPVRCGPTSCRGSDVHHRRRANSTPSSAGRWTQSPVAAGAQYLA